MSDYYVDKNFCLGTKKKKEKKKQKKTWRKIWHFKKFWVARRKYRNDCSLHLPTQGGINCNCQVARSKQRRVFFVQHVVRLCSFLPQDTADAKSVYRFWTNYTGWIWEKKMKYPQGQEYKDSISLLQLVHTRIWTLIVCGWLSAFPDMKDEKRG